MSIIERLVYYNNLRTFGGCYICTGCGRVIPVGQEHWDDLDLPWHEGCVPIVEAEHQPEEDFQIQG